MSYLPWKEIKHRIQALNTRKRGINLIDDINENLTAYPVKELERLYDYYSSADDMPINSYTKDFLSRVLDIRRNYYIRSPYHNILSVKLQLPTGCQAGCEFCYFVSSYGDSTKFNKAAKELFLNNFVASLKEVVRRSYGKPLSLDITGGEPSSDLEFLARVMDILRNEKEMLSHFNRVTFTTNSFKINEALPIIAGVVNYVNISLHSTSFEERTKIFKTTHILNNDELANLVVNAYANYGIKVSSVFVVKELSVDEFSRINTWCMNMGFVTNRIRFDVFSDSHACGKAAKLINECIKTSDYNKVYGEEENEASFFITYFKASLLTFVMSGITDTVDSTYSIGINVLTDGKAYLDFDKKMPIEDFPLPLNYVLVKTKNNK